MLYTAL